MNRRSRNIIGLIPFIALILSAVSGLVSSKEWYYCVFKYLGDSVGYSILFIIPTYLYYRKFLYCKATKLAVIGLGINNLISLFCRAYYDIFKVDIYNTLYDLIVLVLVCIISLILIIQCPCKVEN